MSILPENMVRPALRGNGSALLAGLFCAATGFAAPAAADTVSVTEDYFVQPFYIYGSSVINGLESNGARSATQSFYNAPDGVESTVDLADGALKGYVEAGNTAGVVSQTRLGDTLEFVNGAGTDVDVSLAVDGTILADAITPALNATSQIVVDAYLAVYDASTDVDSSNWACFLFSCTTIAPPSQGPLGSDRFRLDLSDSITSVDETINELLSTTISLVSNRQELKVFGNLTLIGNRTSNPGTTQMDFLNTATFGVETDPLVAFNSASGVFPGSGDVVAPVPVPAAGYALLTGLLALFGLGRRRRSA